MVTLRCFSRFDPHDTKTLTSSQICITLRQWLTLIWIIFVIGLRLISCNSIPPKSSLWLLGRPALTLDLYNFLNKQAKATNFEFCWLFLKFIWEQFGITSACNNFNNNDNDDDDDDDDDDDNNNDYDLYSAFLQIIQQRFSINSVFSISDYSFSVGDIDFSGFLLHQSISQ